MNHKHKAKRDSSIPELARRKPGQEDRDTRRGSTGYAAGTQLNGCGSRRSRFLARHIPPSTWDAASAQLGTASYPGDAWTYDHGSRTEQHQQYSTAGEWHGRTVQAGRARGWSSATGAKAMHLEYRSKRRAMDA